MTLTTPSIVTVFSSLFSFFFCSIWNLSLVAWDVLWQLRGLALTPVHGEEAVGYDGRVSFRTKALKLTLEPRRGLVVCNGRPGHLQASDVFGPRFLQLFFVCVCVSLSSFPVSFLFIRSLVEMPGV